MSPEGVMLTQKDQDRVTQLGGGPEEARVTGQRVDCRAPGRGGAGAEGYGAERWFPETRKSWTGRRGRWQAEWMVTVVKFINFT